MIQYNYPLSFVIDEKKSTKLSELATKACAKLSVYITVRMNHGLIISLQLQFRILVNLAKGFFVDVSVNIVFINFPQTNTELKRCSENESEIAFVQGVRDITQIDDSWSNN